MDCNIREIKSKFLTEFASYIINLSDVVHVVL